MSHLEQLRIQHLEEVAVQMAPAFRDKFDFSSEDNYGQLADFAFKAAAAMIAKADALVAEAQAKDDLETARKAKELELSKAREALK